MSTFILYFFPNALITSWIPILGLSFYATLEAQSRALVSCWADCLSSSHTRWCFGPSCVQGTFWSLAWKCLGRSRKASLIQAAQMGRWKRGKCPLQTRRLFCNAAGCVSPMGFACFLQGSANGHRNQLHHRVPAGKREPGPESEASGKAGLALWGACQPQRLHRLPGNHMYPSIPGVRTLVAEGGLASASGLTLS